MQILGVIKPVAADLVAGQDVSRKRRAADSSDSRRQEVLLDLGGGAGRAGAPDGVDVVGVRGCDRERDGGFGGEIA